MSTNYQMGDEDYKQLGKELGPLGFGIYYLWNAAAPSYKGSGKPLTGWCLAFNYDNDLVFLKTEGYYTGYLRDHPATRNSDKDKIIYVPAGIDVKSRDSDWKFMVLKELFGKHLCRDKLVAYAHWWNGYEVTGTEKDYYMGLIRAAREEQNKKFGPEAISIEEQDKNARARVSEGF
ncbi:hypothetical protein N7460_000232 [Penicillium canescens]|uniref:Uncharacterized protein n=1 Tax=Penicillium canescens TaxID=5083 RepID=A0AAD6INP8_PENCN|nr:hypothetical protein N7460_000232 [Penicillium canescens]